MCEQVYRQVASEEGTELGLTSVVWIWGEFGPIHKPQLIVGRLLAKKGLSTWWRWTAIRVMRVKWKGLGQLDVLFWSTLRGSGECLPISICAFGIVHTKPKPLSIMRRRRCVDFHHHVWGEMGRKQSSSCLGTCVE